MNDDFEGGEFFFTDRDARTVTVRLNSHYSQIFSHLFRSMFIKFSQAISNRIHKDVIESPV